MGREERQAESGWDGEGDSRQMDKGRKEPQAGIVGRPEPSPQSLGVGEWGVRSGGDSKVPLEG